MSEHEEQYSAMRVPLMVIASVIIIAAIVKLSRTPPLVPPHFWEDAGTVNVRVGWLPADFAGKADSCTVTVGSSMRHSAPLAPPLPENTVRASVEIHYQSMDHTVHVTSQSDEGAERQNFLKASRAKLFLNVREKESGLPCTLMIVE